VGLAEAAFAQFFTRVAVVVEQGVAHLAIDEGVHAVLEQVGLPAQQASGLAQGQLEVREVSFLKSGLPMSKVRVDSCGPPEYSSSARGARWATEAVRPTL